MDYIDERGELLKVIANVEDGEIVTVAWDKD
jgi:antitoxin (DNA-binding transcriptional repressor) of toxin-antitoxin stability system